MYPFIGEIRAFGFDFAPYSWAFCNGAHLPINQFSTLYALLGNTYDPHPPANTFGLPNLTGRAPINTGMGSDGTTQQMVTLGQALGADTVSLNLANLPPHSHDFVLGGGSMAPVMTAAPATATPKSVAFRPTRIQGGTTEIYEGWSDAAANTTLSPFMIQAAGTGQAHDNHQPFLSLNFCICLEGLFPPPS